MNLETFCILGPSYASLNLDQPAGNTFPVTELVEASGAEVLEFHDKGGAFSNFTSYGDGSSHSFNVIFCQE
ncbi:hypothetical protein CQA01_19550 [Cyclobacterium qasimii]|uniref:Uncharacterized protein n=1 Tax=Cyclobacterium qasimii TaxID=1350429 RepID=A0A512CB40_9BACT|nr:hypothetical protein CQA01_19550 [Cyclobacterium qasimii]